MYTFMVLCELFVFASFFRVALPWELLYADDLVMIDETEDDPIKRLNEWKDFVENRGMRVNKTKVMISGERQKVRQQAVRWPCGVYGRGIGVIIVDCIIIDSVIMLA